MTHTSVVDADDDLPDEGTDDFGDLEDIGEMNEAGEELDSSPASRLAVARFRLRNFKAVRDSGTVRFTPLTVFIGNNGVGKSSLIEGLETLQSIARDGLDRAMQRWKGFEFIWNQAGQHTLRMTAGGRPYAVNPMTFKIAGASRTVYGESRQPRPYNALSLVTRGEEDTVFFLEEHLKQRRADQLIRTVNRSRRDGSIWDETQGYAPRRLSLPADQSVLSAETSNALWQFVRLDPEAMAQPAPVTRVAGYLPLATNGSNIADYLRDIRDQDPAIVDDIIEALQVMLPYAREVQPVVTSELGRTVYLQLREQGFMVPSWLFSTGTLRLVALLALFRHPKPPPLIVIEEIENGLDPRTLGFIVEEIRDVTQSGRSQVVLTTHSPYLLDLLPLSSIVFVERIEGQPVFTRPADDEGVRRWSNDFAPGRLYTMGRMHHE